MICVFCAGVVLLPKPRLANFLGIRSQPEAAEPLPADLLLPFSVAAEDVLCFLGHAVPLKILPDPQLGKFAPIVEFGNGCILESAVPFPYNPAFLPA